MYSEYKKPEKLVYVKMHYMDMMQQFEQYDASKSTCAHNKEQIKRYRTMDKHDEFSGGTTKDFLSPPDMGPFLSAKERILSSRLDQKIQDAIGFKPKRKRVNDEYDGDWSYDRQWDVKPFNRAFKLPIPNRFVTIDIDFSINCGTEAKAINEYGATVWAICQILEELGISVEIQISTKGTKMYHTPESKESYMGNVNTTSLFEVKKSTEYMSPQALASVFRSVFYRIGIFCNWIIEGDKHGLRADPSLGQPIKPDFNHVKYSDGVLYVTGDVKPESDQVSKAILEIINGKL